MIEIDKFKENVLSKFSIKRDEIILDDKKQRWQLDPGYPIIRVDNENFSLYKKLIKILSNVLLKQYDILLYSILLKEQAKASNIRKVEDIKQNRVSFNNLYEFFATKEGHNVVAIMRDHAPFSAIEFNLFLNLGIKIDTELCVVISRFAEQRTIQWAIETIRRRTGIYNISIMDFPSFLLRFYGKEAKRGFENMAVKLNEELEDIVGYSITEICNSRTLDEFKRKLINEWTLFDIMVNIDYVAPIEKYTEKLVQKFLLEERYKTLFDGHAYSDSYITSEWFYQKYASNIKTTNFDMTAVVAGYFKSIEQLLDSFIVVHAREKVFERRERKNGEYDEIKVGDANYKSMLGKIHNFLGKEENRHLFEEQDKVLQDFYLEKLKAWIDKCRNGFFHKDNINNPIVLAQIRQETLLLYFFTLVMLKFDDEGLE